MTNQADYSKIESTVASIRNKRDAKNARLGLFLDSNKKKELASYKARRDQVYKEYKSYVVAITNLEKLIAGGTLTGTNLTNARKNLTTLKSRRDDAWTRYENLSSQINKIKPAPKLFFPSSGTGVKKPSGPVTVANGGKVNPKGPYRYNAPLLKNALHNPLGPQASSLDNVSINQGNYTDARQAWTGVTPGRGTFQMDKKFVVEQLDGLNRTNSKQVDDQLYGFKFLYNPTSVSMGWGIQGAVDPNYQASGKDEAIPISAGLFSSQLQFSIILNRIEDMNYLNKFGYVSPQMKKIESGALTTGLDPAQRNRLYSVNAIANSPYGETVSVEDQVEIYKKGTMYDIEYLFKTINGPHATFKSELNGTTADRGYMRMSILELHLGANMRYRVRISDLGINHTMFNSRMVPILSTVNFTCHRFIDYSIQDKTSGGGSSSSKSSASSPPAGIGKGY